MRLEHEDYTIAWISALPHELAPAIALLDERHEPLEGISGDKNTYILGRVGGHNVVITGLPKGKIGTNVTAHAVNSLIRSFKNVRCGLMVGVGGGAPGGEEDIRLGDVVVGSAGVLQYDFGTHVQTGGDVNLDKELFIYKGELHEPSSTLQSALSSIEANAMVDGYRLTTIYEEMLTSKPAMKQRFQRPAIDVLYNSRYLHVGGPSCSHCDIADSVARSSRNEVAVHYGKIGCGNQVVRDALFRDRLRLKKGILCFEMEAAGFPRDFDCLVVRGICDYCDSHKNKAWQPYAAAMAAAYAKEILLVLPVWQVESMPKSKILQSINDGLDKIGNDTTQLVNRQKEYDLRKAIAWLHAPEPEANLHAALGRREPGTGSWLLNSEAFTAWKMGSKQHLWLLGKVGCGKTILASTVIEDMRTHCTHNGTGFAMFYFSFSDTSKQTWSDCFRSLLAQLVTTEAAIAKLLEVYKAHSPQSLNDQLLQDIFAVAAASHDSIYIVLDALDESPENSGTGSARTVLLNALNDLAKMYRNIHLFITSRDLPDIRDKLTDMGCEQVVATPDKMDEDIRVYVMSQLISNNRLSKFSKDMKHQVERELIANADGMFRWVYCQIEHLSNLKLMRRSEIERTLASLPRTLDETYERILNSIDNELRSDTVTLLRWLAYAQRPLTLKELSEVLIIDINDKTNAVHTDDRPCDEGILVLLSSLVKKTVIHLEQDDTYEVYELAHFSIKEYMESSRSRLLYFHLEADLSNHLLSRSSIAYLSYFSEQLNLVCPDLVVDSIDTWVNEGEATQEAVILVTSLPLLEYASVYWFEHHTPALGCDDAVQFLTSMENLCGWWISSSMLLPFDQGFLGWTCWSGPTTGLQCALYFRLADVFQALLDIATDLEQPNWGGETALNMGCKQSRYVRFGDKSLPGGSDFYCAMLIEAGADIKARDSAGRAPLHSAAAFDNPSAMKILIEAGADINETSTSMSATGTPLQIAIRRTHFRCIEVLLEAGAELGEWRGMDGQTLLEATILHGVPTTLEMLIGRGVHINFRLLGQITLLEKAALYGHTHIIQILMKHGYSCNSSWLGGPLLAAASRGQIEAMDMLVKDYGFSVEHRSGMRKNAVQAALWSGSKETFAWLIEHGADVPSQLRESGFALIRTCKEKSREDVVAIFDIIYEYYPSYQIPQEHLDEALVKAWYANNFELCKYLGSRGANIKYCFGPDSILLSRLPHDLNFPVEQRRPIVEWLTEYGVDTSSLDLYENFFVENEQA